VVDGAVVPAACLNGRARSAWRKQVFGLDTSGVATRRKQDDSGSDAGVVTETKKTEKLQTPPMYKVLFHNDNYTTMEFVVAVLRDIFHKSESDSVQIMLNVHRNGLGVAGVYTWEIAETKVNKTHALAREADFPLKLTMEPEEL
jgi:ATP-dependent Clp protease adaptor protein ClpS